MFSLTRPPSPHRGTSGPVLDGVDCDFFGRLAGVVLRGNLPEQSIHRLGLHPNQTTRPVGDQLAVDDPPAQRLHADASAFGGLSQRLVLPLGHAPQGRTTAALPGQGLTRR